MKPDCLNERDLILLHYGELSEGTAAPAAAAHLGACPACRARLEKLVADLARIPAEADPDPLVATRIAARVNERLGQQRGRRWLPLAGGAAVAALALVVTFATWPGRDGVAPGTPPQATTVAALELDEEMPDIDFLEDLELVRDLELLRQIEGV